MKSFVLSRLHILNTPFAFLFSIAISAFQLEAAAPQENIVYSLHNLSIRVNVTSMNNEVCAFCHTPHAANQGFSGAPLWNKGMPLQTTFDMYGTTLGGTQTSTAPEPTSLACLSCHDGVSGINSIVNLPGSGGSDPSGQYVKNPSPIVLTGYFAVGLNGDMTDDHPVSIDYRGDETNPPAGLRPTNTPLTDWSNATDIASILRNGKVECVSCHNPHLSSNVDTFLRTGDNKGSKLCYGCHNK